MEALVESGLYIQRMPISRTQSLKISRECLGLRARYLNRVVSRIYDEELRDHDIKVSQFTILVAVSMNPGIRAVDLGHALEIEKSSLSRNLKNTIEQGWLRQSEGLKVTAAGQRVLTKAYPAWNKAQARVKERLGSAGADGLYAATSSILN